MAEDANDVPWSENTNDLIESLAPVINDKYGIALKDILINPAFYVSKKDIETTFSSIRNEVDDYVETTMKGLEDEKKNFEKDGLKCDAVSKQLTQSITMLAKQNNIPVIKPVSIDRNVDNEEVIYVNNIDSGLTALITKLASASSFIADFSTTYKTYSLGQWLFDGHKNYVINVSLEQNSYMDLDQARDELKVIMDGIDAYFKGQGSADEGQKN
ncbi:hypothetical protein Micr_00683 [Candidatus Micrarchaeum sp.]|jgi:hypothetical protein|uniref:hypothetical protein n=1 Tax=Candidatus Micrarchaeum sp. TaxID=2282148 RepID=UPI000A98C026|nr:hypothetical protein [Candidatus Micrarchaeum sp.]OWP53275.1 MAG: hypothetical protein B2I19_05150 [Thermoplasmatales archaeon ARMAN]QRF74152.1 hypothetical protein Micr_00683 [Candidatus Micrarchaeum sp.]